MNIRCPACGKKAMRIPWTFLVESSMASKCAACGSTHTSTLSGALDEARRIVVLLCAAALGASLFVFIYWWKDWILAVVALLLVDSVWKLYLHSRSMRRNKKE